MEEPILGVGVKLLDMPDDHFSFGLRIRNPEWLECFARGLRALTETVRRLPAAKPLSIVKPPSHERSISPVLI